MGSLYWSYLPSSCMEPFVNRSSNSLATNLGFLCTWLRVWEIAGKWYHCINGFSFEIASERSKASRSMYLIIYPLLNLCMLDGSDKGAQLSAEECSCPDTKQSGYLNGSCPMLPIAPPANTFSTSGTPCIGPARVPPNNLQPGCILLAATVRSGSKPDVVSQSGIITWVSYE